MASIQYDRENTTRFNLKFNNRTDAEIIEKLKSVSSMQGYIRHLIQNDIEASKPRHRISIDNGVSFVDLETAVRSVDWCVISNAMDDDILEHVHQMLAPCSEIEFLDRYLRLSPDDLIIG